MYFVYIVQSEKDSKYYVGMTSDIEQRLLEHNLGKTKSLKNRLPVKLVHTEMFTDKTAALKRENQIKSYKGGQAFKKLILQQEDSKI